MRLWDPSHRAVRPGDERARRRRHRRRRRGHPRLASASRDGTVRLWALEDGRLSRGRSAGHDGRVNAVALSEDDSRVVSAGEDRTVRDWGLNSRELVRAYVSHAGAGPRPRSLARRASGCSPGSADRTVRAWDPDGERLAGLAAARRRGARPGPLARGSACGRRTGARSAASSAAPLRPAPPGAVPSLVGDRGRGPGRVLRGARSTRPGRTLAAGDFTAGRRRSCGPPGASPATSARVRRSLCGTSSAPGSPPGAAVGLGGGTLSGHDDTPVAVATAPDGDAGRHRRPRRHRSACGTSDTRQGSSPC